MRQLLDLLPQHYKDIEDIAEVMRAVQFEIDELFTARYNVLNNQFLETSDEFGVSRFEKIYKLEKNSNADLQERKLALAVVMLEMRPTTLNYLKNKLEQICGKENYLIIKDYENNRIEIRLAVGSKVHLNALKDLINKIIPANMQVTIDLLYSRYSDFESDKISLMDDLIYTELKNKYAT